MKVLILGLSSIVQRRVVPALATMEAIEEIDIASVSQKRIGPFAKAGRYFADYAQAIDSSRAELVYVSLPNALHETWITAALLAGKHVVVDKPATLDLAGAQRVAVLARKTTRLFAEATVFNYHGHMARLMEFVAACAPLTHIDAQLIIPPLPKENYRNSQTMGGGCLLDMGPYAAAVSRLFGLRPEKVSAFAAPDYPGRDIDMGFSLLAQCEGGLRYTGHFSFESEYQNRLLVVGGGGSILVERIFTPPADLPIVWETRRHNQAERITQPADDAFSAFLTRVGEALASGQYDVFENDMLADAEFRNVLSQQLRGTSDHATTCS